MSSVPGNTVPVYLQIGCLETWGSRSHDCCYECGGAVFFLSYFCLYIYLYIFFYFFFNWGSAAGSQVFASPNLKTLDSWLFTAGLSLDLS